MAVRLCKNKETGAIFVYNPSLARDPNIVILTPEEQRKYFEKVLKSNSTVLTKGNKNKLKNKN